MISGHICCKQGFPLFATDMRCLFEANKALSGEKDVCFDSTALTDWKRESLLKLDKPVMLLSYQNHRSFTNVIVYYCFQEKKCEKFVKELESI